MKKMTSRFTSWQKVATKVRNGIHYLLRHDKCKEYIVREGEIKITIERNDEYEDNQD